jgi:hypothetical protein
MSEVFMQTARLGDLKVVTVVVDGEPFVARDDHPNYAEIVRLAALGDESVVDLFDLSVVIARKFEQVSDRVSIRDGRVYLDGDENEVHSALNEQIVEFHKAGVDFMPLVNFYDKIEQNPNPDSREQLYAWLKAHKFTITPEGDLLGYKGVRKTADGKYQSINHGRAIVNGEEFTGAIPNNPGDVVTMPRSEVEHNPSSGCSRGLHVGTWNYASDFAQGEVLEVVVNPRDVVSVPHDCNAQKLRTCRYVVGGVAKGDYGTPLKASSWNSSAYDDYDEDEWSDNDYDDPWA